jgi:LysM repeat protein
MIHEVILAGALFFNPQVEKDSIGIEKIDGRMYIIHRVDEKETLFAISRRYGSSVESILQSNPGATSNLEIGQIIRIPYDKKVSVRPVEGSKIHIVAAKETMYSISKMYNVTIDDLRKWNNLTDNTISIGQQLVVGKTPAVEVRPDPARPNPANQPTPTVMSIPSSGAHTVGTKETLYSIARQYGLSVGQLRSWNALENDELKVGQIIRLTEMKTDQPAGPVTAAREETRPEPVENRSETQKNEVPAVQPSTQPTQPSQPSPTAKSSQSTQPAQSGTQTIRISESMKNSDEVIEAGLAELIEGTEGNRKYLAMHRTAPVGTILKVRNEMNNREVFVRVMGKLPDTAVNDKLIIKLSRSAYDRLGAIDPRFRVELTYYK